MTWREVVYEYDGSFDGLLCCIYESYMQKELPAAFFRTGELNLLYAGNDGVTDAIFLRSVLHVFPRLFLLEKSGEHCDERHHKNDDERREPQRRGIGKYLVYI